MKRIFWWTVVLLFFCTPFAWAETWMVRSAGPSGGVRETRWDVRREGGRTEYFVHGQSSPVYILYVGADEARLELGTGMTRRFSPGFLLLIDLPLPVFSSGSDKIMSGDSSCFQEYVGETAFRFCVNVILAESPDQALALPTPQPGSVILVLRDGQVAALVGPDVQAWLVE